MQLQTNRRLRHAAFSLLELLVCISILASVASVLVIRGYELVASHQFRGSAHSFLAELQKWKILSLIHDCDISCTISQQGSEYFVTWSPEFPLHNAPKERHHPLIGTKQLLWEGIPTHSFHTILLSSGRPLLQGTLTFIPKEERQALSIDWHFPLTLRKKDSSKQTLPLPPPYPEKKKERLSILLQEEAEQLDYPGHPGSAQET
ncbi:MAG: type II secretion system protein [Chlamydiae bacterium]|nr:type II secretion system protein [Chlamydiota bacterium]